jgi:nitrogen fixation protein FixH
MKNSLMLIGTFWLILSGCSSSEQWQAAIKEKEVNFKEGEKIPLVLEIKDRGKPVAGLVVKAILEMKTMDHGQIEVVLHDNGDGIYKENVQLPMDGDWIADVNITNGKKKMESALSFKAERTIQE